MPDALPPGPFVPQTDIKQPQVFAQRAPVNMQDLQRKFADIISDLNSRVRMLEERVENLRSHIDLLDNSVIEKHKTLISEVRRIEDGQRALRADMDMLKDVTERLARRLDAFASKEEVKVLERYVELWQPLNFVTRSELKNAVQSILKMAGIKIKEEAE